MRIWPGTPYPLGATWDGVGVNFALFSENAERVELCLFDSPEDTRESRRIQITEYTDHVWHAYLPDARPGQLYAYRVYGQYDPERGLRFNPYKLLLDPYAKAVVRVDKFDDTLFSYPLGLDDLTLDTRDNGHVSPLGVVIDPAFTWGGDTAPKIPWHKTVIYEAHVKGMSALHPLVPKELRGTYAGFATEPVIRHLLELGVTAVEILPVHQKFTEPRLRENGLTNYWGYNTLSYFAPDASYTCFGGYLAHVREFKSMVRTYHEAGIEIILDVVYNHSCEGNHLGPTLSFKGIDNPSYYKLVPEVPRYYADYTGCGNTLNMGHPRVLQLVMDSLRYWVLEMHVDGFRFDLASALARETHEVNNLASFFEIIHQDPVLSQVKLIAEPWDLGEDGYQVGNFPVLWTEWNGRYRDLMRDFWNHGAGTVSEFATRLAGSSDLYGGERKPYASINFITCHDGFTLRDLVTYQEKHNLQNLESNNDGTNDNRSVNFGFEGETKDEEILELRAKQMRNLMATLLLSAGVPMISGGDELSRTQQGNNNAYCQDNELSWNNWELDNNAKKFLQYVRNLLNFRLSEPVFLRRKFFTGKKSQKTGVRDISWFGSDGMEMVHWNRSRALGVVLAGNAIDELGTRGETIEGATVMVIYNAENSPIDFCLPAFGDCKHWGLVMKTADGKFYAPSVLYEVRSKFEIEALSLALFRLS